MYVVVGLGNPGKKYEMTRHNVGFNTIDFLADKLNVRVDKIKHKALCGEGNIGNEKVLLVKPQTFMNLSGESVLEIQRYYKVPLSNIIVIYDDLDLPVGKVRIKKKGSAGTHNGMRSILHLIQSEDFPRIRIGIGMPQDKSQLINYVVGDFSKAERALINEAIELSAEAVLEIIRSNADSAMNKFNKK